MKKLLLCLSLGLGAAAGAGAPIDRHALVTRHNIECDALATTLPLGNGEFCFTADATGLQTFAGNAMAQWGWHSFPLPEGWTPDRVPPTGTFQQGRNTGGDKFPKDTAVIRTWMFDNPHRLNLARLRFCHADGRALETTEISAVKRTLDLWTGTQTAHFEVAGQPVHVETCVDPQHDAVAVRIESPLLARGELLVTLDFPYASIKSEPWVGNWAQPELHTTKLTRHGERSADFARQLDGTRYNVRLAWSAGARLDAPTNAPSRKMSIKKALYGGKEAWLDVTAKVLAKIQGGEMSITPSYSWLGDPLPGQAKQLKLTVVTDGREESVVVADGATFSIAPRATPHAFKLVCSGTNRLEFACAFAATPMMEEGSELKVSPGSRPRSRLGGMALQESNPNADSSMEGRAPSRPLHVLSVATDIGKVFDANAQSWKTFWSTGGALDLSGSKDPRWRELERRVVLSQYHTAAMSSGSWPPAETALLGIDSWRGQFHMEMVWWHLAHFALWDRWDRATNALTCYQRFTPAARALAEQLGYKGLKWPKSVGPEGRSAPWAGNQVLLWKQPHPLFFAELDYRRNPTRATLEKWREVVFGTAEHMADYPTRDDATGLYHLVPAMPPSEQGITRDTVFDLAYWRWGLDAAQRWRERLGLAREPRWDEVRAHLAPLPESDGVFVHSAEWFNTYTQRNYEHPDPVGVLGMLPPIQGVDAATAHRTVLKVWETWHWDRTWGWDCPWMAMAAARVGEPRLAVEALLKDTARNRFDERGINLGGPCPYLPGNGGLLYAIAMMAAGWEGAPDKPAPGFPDDGSWCVKWEGLKPAL